MTDHTTIQEIKATEEKLAALRAKLEEQQNPKPGPPKDGKIWATEFDDQTVLWLEDGRNLRLVTGGYGTRKGFDTGRKPRPSHTVPLADLRALVEAHDPAKGEPPPSYADLLYAWNHPCARPACPPWLDTTGATKDRSKFPPLEPDCQLWRKANGKIIMPHRYGPTDSLCWDGDADRIVIAKHAVAFGYDGDGGPDHALVEYLGRVK